MLGGDGLPSTFSKRLSGEYGDKECTHGEREYHIALSNLYHCEPYNSLDCSKADDKDD